MSPYRLLLAVTVVGFPLLESFLTGPLATSTRLEPRSSLQRRHAKGHRSVQVRDFPPSITLLAILEGTDTDGLGWSYDSGADSAVYQTPTEVLSQYRGRSKIMVQSQSHDLSDMFSTPRSTCIVSYVTNNIELQCHVQMALCDAKLNHGWSVLPYSTSAIPLSPTKSETPDFQRHSFLPAHLCNNKIPSLRVSAQQRRRGAFETDIFIVDEEGSQSQRPRQRHLRAAPRIHLSSNSSKRVHREGIDPGCSLSQPWRICSTTRLG